jgi:hypothetical protein
MKQLKVKDLRRARARTIKESRNERLEEQKAFKELMSKAQDLYIKGLPTMQYEVKPGLVEQHMGFWQKHPVWSELIALVTKESHTKTRIILVLNFRN